MTMRSAEKVIEDFIRDPTNPDGLEKLREMCRKDAGFEHRLAERLHFSDKGFFRFLTSGIRKSHKRWPQK